MGRREWYIYRVYIFFFYTYNNTNECHSLTSLRYVSHLRLKISNYLGFS
ncbi:MAG: hypothetical protein [Siphoviridae sp. ct7UA22]|nr:MAG: hypothetical protein [Siphoviridae sp. ct7UA22]